MRPTDGRNDGPAPGANDPDESDGTVDAAVGPDAADPSTGDGTGVAADGTSTAASGPDAPVVPDRLLLAGESLEAAVGVGRGWLAVTSHRLLAFDPEGDGKHLRAPNRLNVLDVRATAAGDPTLLRWTARAAIYAVLLFVGWLLARQIGLGSLLDVRRTGMETTGLGALRSILSAVDALLGLLVVGLFVAAVVAGLAALVLGVRYLQQRQRTIRVEVAGEEPVELPLPRGVDGEGAARTVREALSGDLTLDGEP